ncbi:tubulin binding cofactor C-domain-containing protein [Sporodiniella umbellata]|nr:tubulin binding cofactor C-domain-containing protein [Sporodiniella umbellata]
MKRREKSKAHTKMEFYLFFIFYLFFFSFSFNNKKKMATDAANEFWYQFKAEQSSIEALIVQSDTVPELSSHFNLILQRINALEKKITDSLAFIPSYDERQFSLQIKALNEKLTMTKTRLQPKAKFSFRSRPSKGVKPAVVEEKAPEVERDVVSKATILLKDRSDMVLRLDGLVQKPGMDVLLSDLSRCVILLETQHTISAVHIKNLENCLLFCGSIDGSVLIYGITRSIVSVDCHQLRIHNAQQLDVLMHVTSRPIIEDSQHITTGQLTEKENTVNYFNQLEDFNWLKKQPSPHWKLMPQERADTLKSLNLAGSDQDLLQLLSLIP